MAIVFEDGKLIMNELNLVRREGLSGWFKINEKDEFVPSSDREFRHFLLGFSRVVWLINEEPSATELQRRAARIHLRRFMGQLDMDQGDALALQIYDPNTWEYVEAQS